MTSFDAEITKHVFDWRKVQARNVVSRTLLNLPPGVVDPKLSIENVPEFIAEHFVVSLRAYVLTHYLGKHDATRTQLVYWPATPWQHWKQRHALRWWLAWLVRRRPVRTVFQTVDYREVWDELVTFPWQERVPAVPLGSPTRRVEVLVSDWTVSDAATR